MRSGLWLSVLVFTAGFIAPMLTLLVLWNRWVGWALIALVVTAAVMIKPDD